MLKLQFQKDVFKSVKSQCQIQMHCHHHHCPAVQVRYLAELILPQLDAGLLLVHLPQEHLSGQKHQLPQLCCLVERRLLQ